MNDGQRLTIDERRTRLQQALTSQTAPGMRIEAQSDISASLVFGGGTRRVITIADDGRCEFVEYPPRVHRDTASPWIRHALVIGVGALMIGVVAVFLRGFNPTDLNTETTYRVTSADGTAGRADITYATDSGGMAEELGFPLPWSYRSDRFLWGRTMYVAVQNRSAGCITVEIHRNGTVRKAVQACGNGTTAVAKY